MANRFITMISLSEQLLSHLRDGKTEGLAQGHGEISVPERE